MKPKHTQKVWTPEEKLELVAKVIAGASIISVLLMQELMMACYISRKSKNSEMKKVGTKKPSKPNESEYEELIRLRAENEYMKAEIELIKKEIALREEKEAARLKAKKQQSLKNSVKRDTH